jgi:hypothetical protein
VYLEAVRTIVAAARRHGKGLGFMAADAGWASAIATSVST